MIPRSLARTGLLAICVLGLTAFSQPLADRGRDFARLLHGTPLGCAKCSDGSNIHQFPPFGGGAYFDCNACNSCHSNWQSGWCNDYHCGCGGDTEDVLIAGERLTAQKVAEVAAYENSADVLAFLARHPSRVQYNSHRGVLQLLTCDERIAAQFPVEKEVAAALD